MVKPAEDIELFRGLTAINLDVKGRLAIPTRYRDQLLKDHDGQLVTTIDTEEPCLLLYPLSEWLEIEQQLEALPSFNPVSRRIQRLLIGHATELTMDGQGRILLPPPLRDYAGLDKRVMLVGQGRKRFEIWDEDKWSAERQHWLADAKLPKELPAELQSLSL